MFDHRLGETTARVADVHLAARDTVLVRADHMPGDLMLLRRDFNGPWPPFVGTPISPRCCAIRGAFVWSRRGRSNRPRARGAQGT
jgi:hypothetical protein